MSLVPTRRAVGGVTTLCAILTACAATEPCQVASSPSDYVEAPTSKLLGDRPGVVFRNEMSSAFVLMRTLAVLDGDVLFDAQVDDNGSLPSEIVLHRGALPPGEHTLQILLKLRGHGYGPFAYLRGYRFEVKSSHSFTVKEGDAFRLAAIAWERGHWSTPLEQRPAICYAEGVVRMAVQKEPRRAELAASERRAP